ncbi:NAD(P)-binding domain-containing protein [Campylobacter sp. 19-13652]|uniref:NAD(P)-binding domain-containing protein n=1 Tax=Campylobacter sp. 19-13652 TaxID=2840180 RepID=UPI001C753CAC|nr:NAD(P)-binding domain-containing protein [Campylobacter sp. 19-13652]BCX79480.1 pyridine nucleotide-disulfide oxidoreductase [Campylobacter sp. 19-13652]
MNLYDVIIIGAGPSGIAAALEAKKAGLSALILEKADEHSQTMRKFYKDGKRVDKEYKGQDSTIHGNVDFMDGTKESTLEYFDKLLDQVEIKYKSEVEKVSKDGDKFIASTASAKYEAKYVIIAIGKMGKPNKPDYKIPLTLNPRVNYNANSVAAGERVLVVGGGNSAVEYAIDLAGKNDTTLSYRKDSFTRINETNAEELKKAESKGLKVWLNSNIEAVDDENSKPLVKFKDGSAHTFDRIIYAIGGSNPTDFLNKCGVKTDEKGNGEVNENNETNISGLYLVGDVSLKSGGSVVTGFNHSFNVIKDIKSRS